MYETRVGVSVMRTLAPAEKVSEPVVVGQLLETRADSKTALPPMVIGEA